MYSREPEQLRKLVANVRLYSRPILVHSYLLSWYALWVFDEPEPEGGSQKAEKQIKSIIVINDASLQSQANRQIVIDASNDCGRRLELLLL